MRRTSARPRTLTQVVQEFDHRVAEWRRDLESALAGVYGDEADTVGKALVERARAAATARPQELVDLDRARSASPYWYQGRQRIG